MTARMHRALALLERSKGGVGVIGNGATRAGSALPVINYATARALERTGLAVILPSSVPGWREEISLVGQDGG